MKLLCKGLCGYNYGGIEKGTVYDVEYIDNTDRRYAGMMTGYILSDSSDPFIYVYPKKCFKTATLPKNIRVL